MPIRSTTIVAVVIAFVVAAVVARIASIIIQRTLDALDTVSTENRAAVRHRGRQLARALTLLAYGVAAVASISLALTRFGLGESRWDPRVVARWTVSHGVNVIIIIAGALVVVRAAHLAIDHLQFKLAHGHASTDLEWQRRATTLGGIGTSLVTAIVGFFAVLMLLRELAI